MTRVAVKGSKNLPKKTEQQSVRSYLEPDSTDTVNLKIQIISDFHWTFAWIGNQRLFVLFIGLQASVAAAKFAEIESSRLLGKIWLQRPFIAHLEATTLHLLPIIAHF